MIKKSFSFYLNYFLHTVMFFTRIPVGEYIKFEEKILFASRVLGPLVGLLIGAIEASSFLVLYGVFGKNIAIIFAVLFTIFLTGGLHEDGLADSADAFGASGRTKEQLLIIMKDSRIGTFGTLALIFALLLTFYSLYILPLSVIPQVLIFSHVASRFSVLPHMLTLKYVRQDSVFERVMKNRSSYVDPLKVLIVGVSTALLGFLFFGPDVIWFFVVTLTVIFLTGSYYKKRIGGVTGDCYGATIKISEIACLLLAVVLYRL